jgi:hypothetical protein
MGKDEHAPLHAEKHWELGEDDGLAGASWKTDELTPYACLIAMSNSSKAFPLIIAQIDLRLHDAEYTSFAAAAIQAAAIACTMDRKLTAESAEITRPGIRSGKFTFMRKLQEPVPANNSVLTENVALVYSGCYVQQPWVTS